MAATFQTTSIRPLGRTCASLARSRHRSTHQYRSTAKIRTGLRPLSFSSGAFPMRRSRTRMDDVAKESHLIQALTPVYCQRSVAHSQCSVSSAITQCQRPKRSHASLPDLPHLRSRTQRHAGGPASTTFKLRQPVAYFAAQGDEILASHQAGCRGCKWHTWLQDSNSRTTDIRSEQPS